MGQAGGVPASDYERAHAKLTRSLRVTGVRDDGYHLLESEMVSLDLADDLQFVRGSSGLQIVDEVAWTGGDPDRSSPGRSRRSDRRGVGRQVAPGAENLVSRALAATNRSARVRLVKRIPHGAGLGGGSADAAAVLRWAGEVRPDVAMSLGSDVAFCLRGGRAMVRGAGEEIEPLVYERIGVAMVTPPIAVPTPGVYRAYDELGGPRGEHGNDLEPAALALAPRLSWWRDLLAEVTSLEPRLAGSGGTFFVECDPGEAARLAAQLIEATALSRAVVTAAVTVPARLVS